MARKLFLTALLCAAACVLARPAAEAIHQLLGHGLLGRTLGAHVDQVLPDLYSPERLAARIEQDGLHELGFQLSGSVLVCALALLVLLSSRMLFSRPIRLVLWCAAGFALINELATASFEAFAARGDIGIALARLTDRVLIHNAVGAVLAVTCVAATDAWLRHVLVGARGYCGVLTGARRPAFLLICVLGILLLQAPAALLPVVGRPALEIAARNHPLELIFYLDLPGTLAILLLGLRPRVSGLPTPRPLAWWKPCGLALVAAGACLAWQSFLAAGVRL